MYNFNPDQNGRRVLTWVKRKSLRLYLNKDNKSVLIDESDITNYKRKINDHALVCISINDIGCRNAQAVIACELRHSFATLREQAGYKSYSCHIQSDLR